MVKNQFQYRKHFFLTIIATDTFSSLIPNNYDDVLPQVIPIELSEKIQQNVIKVDPKEAPSFNLMSGAVLKKFQKNSALPVSPKFSENLISNRPLIVIEQ